ncbi:hypothetical protein, conserved [Eimeria tenella]|uniref:Uncharacterized protein n=1 Tax=Eimeria tenella TaxID=5802 RepID=U6KWL7_EIMTE|nr:hypothetical protein, conserved [Eimeria tenella]CDJ42366.1 hypothetical protein, conserved [Eimeria tenella]|eukprot:XP_013233116.1 hypothetical protein, conserved [Eimeria tenella]
MEAPGAAAAAGLAAASSGVFLSHFEEQQGPLDSAAAGDYFRSYLEREKSSSKRIIHERELPRGPPHRFEGGPPGPLGFGYPFSDDKDPGVAAVAAALFGCSAAFAAVPLAARPVFKKRQKGDLNSDWANAFVTRVDPCECAAPEETFTPFELARYRDN